MAISIDMTQFVTNADGSKNSNYPLGDKFAVSNQYAIGVPHPDNYFLFYNPLTVSRPANPAEWPSAQNTQFYYIDNTDINATDTANDYGYPDKPRLTLPASGTTFPAGTVMVIKGDGYTTGSPRWDWVFEGTGTAPCFIVGEDLTKSEINKEIRLSGCSHLIIDGLKVTQANGGRIGMPSSISSPNSYITVRNMDAIGSGIAAGNNSVFSCAGVDATTRTEYVVFYNNLVHDWGDDDSLTENDYHAFLPDTYCSYVWCIGNTAYNMAGDSIQIGQATYTGLQRPDHVYVAKNIFHDDRENAVDIKGAIDVIVSENEGYNYFDVDSSDGTICVIHDDNEYVWILNNKFYNGTTGVTATAGSNVFVLGNEIRDMNGTVNFGAPWYEPNTAIKMTNAGPFTVAHNTVHNAVIGYASHSGSVLSGSEVSGNIFAGRQDLAQGWDFMGESSVNAPSLTVDYNAYEDFRGRVSSTDYETLATWTAGTVYDDNAAEGAMLFTNEASDDFTLQASSPAIDAVTTEAAAYALFENRYGTSNGLSIRYDINGNSKPTSNADAGAYQRIV